MSGAAYQLSLLDWAPASLVARFDDRAIRAQTLSARICRAIGASLRECGLEREAVAARISAFLGAKVSVNALNAYTSQARADREISLTRFIGLLVATRDRRLLELIAEPCGWAVIERRYLPLIELALVREKRRELARHQRSLERSVGTV